MIYIVPIVHMWDSLYQELNGRLYGHEERKEKSSERQRVTESIYEEKENADQLSRHCAPDELSQHHFSTSMS